MDVWKAFNYLRNLASATDFDIAVFNEACKVLEEFIHGSLKTEEYQKAIEKTCDDIQRMLDNQHLVISCGQFFPEIKIIQDELKEVVRCRIKKNV